MRRTNWRPSKKIAEEVLQEAKREIDLILTHIFHDKDTIGRLDLEATEFSIRHSMHQVGGALLEKLINADSGGRQGPRIPCGLGHPSGFVDYRVKKVATVLASVKINRAYYHCPDCKKGFKSKGPRSGHCRNLLFTWGKENDGSGGSQGIV